MYHTNIKNVKITQFYDSNSVFRLVLKHKIVSYLEVYLGLSRNNMSSVPFGRSSLDLF